MQLEQLIDRITADPLFLRLQHVIENNDSHDHEAVYDHCVKTMDNAKEFTQGSLITNQDAKKLYNEWLNEDVFGVQRKDILILVALLHDCGKLLNYKESGETKPLITPIPQMRNQTLAPGHEYWGGELVVKEILKVTPLSNELKEHIAHLVKIHCTFLFYFTDKQTWPISELVTYVKANGGNYYREALFNAYVDGYGTSTFKLTTEKIVKLFNEPALFTQRTYFIP